MKSFVFCTAWANSENRWHNLYGRWINYLENSNLDYDQILMIDDGSPFLPTWNGVAIINEGNLPEQLPPEKAVIYHFNNNLGHFYTESPGWYRSFMFAAEYAEKYKFDRIFHIENDAFLISERIHNYVNGITEGWNTFWCPRHNFAENNIQIIAGSSIQTFIDWKNEKVPYDKYKGTPAEFWTPYTNINKEFYGDRWGEFAPGMARVPDFSKPAGVPKNADFVCQVFEESPCWWITD